MAGLTTKRLAGENCCDHWGNQWYRSCHGTAVRRKGSCVFINGKSQSEVDKAVNQIGKNMTGVQGDVSNLADLDRLYDTVKHQKGQFDILFANAGLWDFAPLEAITETHYDKMFNVNVKGLLFTVQKALPLFKDGGSIILTGSAGGSKGLGTFSVYSATKAAINTGYQKR